MMFVRQPLYTKIAGIFFVFIVVVYILLDIESRYKSSIDIPRRTTYGTSPGGYKAFYLWMGFLGFPIERFERSLNELSGNVSVLIIAEPEFGFGTGELDSLRDWIADGGTLIFTDNMTGLLWKQFGLNPVSDEVSLKSKSNEKGLLFLQPGPYTEGVRTLERTGYFSLVADSPETIFPVSDDSGGVVAVARQGKGRIIAISDPGLLSNKNLKEEDNSRLAFNLLLTHRWDNDAIFVDEYHHGYGRATSVMRHFFQSGLFGPAVQMAIAFILLWAAFGRRFGPSRPANKTEYHSSMELIEALARLHKKAGTRDYALEGTANWIRDEAKRLLINHDMHLQKSMDEISRSIQKGIPTDGELLELVQRLYDNFENARNRGAGYV